MTLIDERPGVRLPPVDLSVGRHEHLTRELASRAEHYDRTAEFPWRSLHDVHESGLLTATVGAAHGGRGLSALETVRVFQSLGRGDPSVALITSMTLLNHGVQAHAPFWPEDLYRRVLEESVERPVLINTVRAEPELGAPARGGLPTTTVRRVGNSWVLNGRKGYATGSEGLAYHLVWAVSDDDQPVIGHVIVPGDTPGIEIVPTWDHLGMRATSTHDVIYTDVVVPFDQFVGVPVGSVPNNAVRLGGSVLSVTALYLGVAQAAQEFFLRFASERVPSSLGRPIATTEHIRRAAGEIEAHIVSAESVLEAVAARLDAGDDDGYTRAGTAKLLVSRAAISAVETAVAALGNPALTRHNPLERHLRDVLCARPHPPQDDMSLLATGDASFARWNHTHAAARTGPSFPSDDQGATP